MKLHERKPAPVLDAWMLDHWLNPALHVMFVMERTDSGGDKEYRSVCSCGWRSLPFPFPTVDPCPVLEALRERSKRLRKDTERLEWFPVVVPRAESGVVRGSSQADGHHDELDRGETGERDAVRGCTGETGEPDTREVEHDPRD